MKIWFAVLVFEAGDCNLNHLGIVNLNAVHYAVCKWTLDVLIPSVNSCEAAADYEIDCKAILHTFHTLRSVFQGQFARVNLMNTEC